MARRHYSGTAAQWRITRPALAVLVFLVFCLIAASAVAIRHFGSSTTARPTCGRSVTIKVAVAPGLLSPLQQYSQLWNNIRFTRDGTCIESRVYSTNAATEEALLATSGAEQPTIWIPDSSYWVSKLQSDLTTRNADHHIGTLTVHPSVALSPLVLVASPSQTAALAAKGSTTWASVAALAGAGELAMENPLLSTEGLLGLTALQSALGATAGFALGPLAQTMSTQALRSVDDGFAQLRADPQRARPFLASEQEVADANARHGATFATSTYISDGTLSLDYPVVRLDYPGQNPVLAPGADGFYEAFAAQVAAKVTTAGLRDSSGVGRPLANGDVSTSGLPFTKLSPPAPGTPAQVWSAWPGAGRDPRVLFALDVSQLMKQTVGSGETKAGLEVTTALALSGFLADSAQVGLWGYAVNLTDTLDWLERVSVGALGDGGRRDALLNQTSLLSVPTPDGSALYDTTLAAFYNVANNYQPGRDNDVVVMTGSGNRDATSVTLDQLLTTLRQQYNPARPVHIITIAVGDGADNTALELISSATGGRSYQADNSTQALQFLLDQLVSAR